MQIPYDQLSISKPLQATLESADTRDKLLLAQGQGLVSDMEALSVLLILANDSDGNVASTAKNTVRSWDESRVIDALNGQIHAKVLEFLVETRPYSSKLDQNIFQCLQINERTARLILQRADAATCEQVIDGQQQFILYPGLFWFLKRNSNCPSAVLSRLESFLKMQEVFVEEPSELGAVPSIPKIAIDNIALEVMTALQRKPSPALSKALDNMLFLDVDFTAQNSVDLGDFSFEFEQDSDVAFDDIFTNEDLDSDDRVSLEQQIREMNVGHKIKLAFKGNKEARSILIRDRNKSVSVAVIKSGRVSDGEAATYAANRNLADDVIREIANNKEWLRKKQIRVALVGNPKTPIKTSMSILATLDKKDLQALARNRNVPSVISKAAMKKFKETYR